MAQERSAVLPFLTAAGSAYVEFPFLNEAIHPGILFNDLATIHGDPTFTFIASAITLTLVAAFASRGFANIAKTASILAKKEDQYYGVTDGFKKRHPVLGRVFLPANLIRTR